MSYKPSKPVSSYTNREVQDTSVYRKIIDALPHHTSRDHLRLSREYLRRAWDKVQTQKLKRQAQKFALSLKKELDDSYLNPEDGKTTITITGSQIKIEYMRSNGKKFSVTTQVPADLTSSSDAMPALPS